MPPRRRLRDVATLSEISAALQIKRPTLYVMARAGEIPVRFSAGRYVMARSVLERLIRERQAKEQPAPAA
jgi:predicted site-specific integrase-resolvase